MFARLFCCSGRASVVTVNTYAVMSARVMAEHPGAYCIHSKVCCTLEKIISHRFWFEHQIVLIGTIEIPRTTIQNKLCPLRFNEFRGGWIAHTYAQRFADSGSVQR